MGLNISDTNRNAIKFSNLNKGYMVFSVFDTEGHINTIKIDKEDLELIYNHLKISLKK